MKKIQNLTTVKLFAVALVATLLFAGGANAQNAYSGKFTLPYEVRWDRAMLPAGEYQLRVDYMPEQFVTIQEAKSGKTVAKVLCFITESDKNTKDGSALLIASSEGQKIVHSLKLAELGKVFIYDPALARGQDRIEARKTQPVRILAAK